MQSHKISVPKINCSRLHIHVMYKLYNDLITYPVFSSRESKTTRAFKIISSKYGLFRCFVASQVETLQERREKQLIKRMLSQEHRLHRPLLEKVEVSRQKKLNLIKISAITLNFGRKRFRRAVINYIPGRGAGRKRARP